MFILLFYFLLNMKSTFSTITILNTGVYEIMSDDIGMILYVTVENNFEHSVHIAVDFYKCLEGDPYSESADYMFLLGGDMGHMDRKSTKNLTLIYPNFFLRNRIGKCLILIRYQNDNTAELLRTEISFQSSKYFREQDGTQAQDYTGTSGNSVVDCAIKYSSRRSYFDRDTARCQNVPACPPSSVYLPKSNTCRKLYVPVCKSDLEMIEEGFFESCHGITNMVNFFCHHGRFDTNSGYCICDEDWTTATCSENTYHPDLKLYHMCNIEVKSWEKANRGKVFMTILVLLILALALAGKMLLALCILNWCCQYIKSKSKEDDEYRVYEKSLCDHVECIQEGPDKIIKVCFSHVSGSSTDVTVSVEADDTSSRDITCPCNESPE